MNRRYFFNRLALFVVAVMTVTIAHSFLQPKLPEVKSEFEMWLNDYEKKLLEGQEEEVRVEVTVKTKRFERRWLLLQPAADAKEKNLILRVLQLVREGELLENSTDNDQFVLIDVQAPGFQSKSKTAWDRLSTNLPAKNMFVLLESVRPTTITPLANEKRENHEKQG